MRLKQVKSIKGLSKCLLLVAAISFASVAQNFTQSSKNKLPEIGIVASDAITLDKEIAIGDAVMRQLRGQAPIVNDPLLEEYIQDIGNRLVAQAENAKFPFEFFLLNSPEINAFAFFGGHIGVHTGLIFNANNESELASVLAHEVTHVTQRHLARKAQASKRSAPLQIASALGGILLALANPEAGVAAISAGSAAAQQSSINYTRSNEKEADRIGFQILYQAGFDVRAAASFFATLAAKYRLVSRPPAFLLTHPLPESRIADARSRAASYPERNLPPSLNFHLAKARVQARYYASAERNIAYFQAVLKKQRYRIKEAAEYGLALSYLRNQELTKAENIIRELRRKNPDNLFYLDTATDIELEQKRFAQAISLLAEHNQRTPHNRVLTLNLANALIKNGDYDKATRLLKDYLLVNSGHMLTYQLLSDAYQASKQQLEMHQTKAEIFALVAAYPKAIDELQHAYTFAMDSNLEKQRIRARIEQMREAEDRLRAL